MDQPQISFRAATAADLPAIVAMLYDDPIGRQRETPGDPPAPAYVNAFEAIAADPNQLLAVALDGAALDGAAPDGAALDGTAVTGGQVVGTLQITFIHCLARTGMTRGQIEAVRIAGSHRGLGLGHRMFDWAIEQCRARGCGLVQLTSDKSRTDAHRFYQSLGFKPVHEGYKLEL